MSFLRKHWYDLGGLLAVAVFLYLFINFNTLTNYRLVLWFNLTALFLHQLEEYRFPGTFPGMVNKAVYRSPTPDRYPLNTNTAFYVNVPIGWTLYFAAALLAEKAVWLGMATILVSVGNVVAHTVVFNVKGKSLYNAGLLTSGLLFAPCSFFFFYFIQAKHLAAATDWLIGVPLGILINAVGILKAIDWMADQNTVYVFAERNLLPADRKRKATEEQATQY